MLAPDIIKQGLSIEKEVVVEGETRWVTHADDQSKPLLVVEYGTDFYALPLYCEHAHASLLEAKITDSGKLICPKHGQETDLLSCEKSMKVTRLGETFRVKKPELIATKNIESGLCSADDSDETAVLKAVNNALQKKVLSNLESMDAMLSQVEHQKVELEESNQHLVLVNELIAGVMNSIEEFIVVTDNVGRITRANRYAADILGVRIRDLVGRSPDELLCQEALNEISENFPIKNWDSRPYLYRAIYREKGFEQEIKFRNLSDQAEIKDERSFLLRGTLLFNHQGKEEGLILSATDISLLKEKEKVRRQKDLEQHILLLKSTLATLVQGVAMFDEQGDLLIWNEQFSQIAQSNLQNIDLGARYQDLFTQNTLVQNAQLQPSSSQLLREKYRWIQHQVNGSIVECESSPTPSGGFVISTRDITQSRRDEEHIRLLSSTVEQSTNEVIITDTDGIIVYVNPMFTENTGYLPEEAIGRKSSIVQSGEMSAEFYRNLWETIKKDNCWKGEIINRKKSGEKFWQSMSISPIHDETGAISHYLSLKSDITKQKEAERQLRYQAEHDLLTKLPNRPVLLAEMDSAIDDARNNHCFSAVLFMDLDNFKDVNDTLGHLSGDFLLQLVAKRLEQCISITDVIARLGGDEFAIIQRGIKSKHEPSVLAEKVINAITTPFRVDDHLLHIGISIGITLIPEDGLETGMLLSNADMAMYEAKAISGSHYKFFDHDLQLSIQRKRLIESHLHNAINNNELNLLLQPKIEIHTGHIVGAEALLRWHSTEIGQVSPAEFIPIAEKSGQIIELGNWVLNQALQLIKDWCQKGYKIPKIAVNLSAVQLKDVNLVQDIKKALEHYQVHSEYLELEITETAAMSDPEFSNSQLSAIKAMNITLAMDDFGTGYSSLSYLASLPIDRVKIDRSFVSDIQHSNEARGIIESIIHLGKILNKTVIAEGVEETEQLELLKRLGCHEAQGYLISRPVASSEFIALLGKADS
ncbi:EAL domain-containing protein [Neptuniibacter caesariensis]|uniref:Signal transduction protein containing membrane, EAL and GGDEF domains-like n=1 Tax=Neptuniibacter caesariensis TaxID=207954 RepID=A0A7U8C337_NEPCE|nr:EAL domain-containing protein [Neptuniibacter caesariensis]EAR60617.1 signal transduction protein containing membrane, EAL and GGDEF domains-like [Oceanospirillum sp. MED92] [Neptuniibacter caesariensis]